jgi:hypothetical protein
MPRPIDIIDLDDLGLDEGAHLLVKDALRKVPAVRVRGRSPTLDVDLPAWCRVQGYGYENGWVLRPQVERYADAVRAGSAAAPVDHPLPWWNFAARGALVERGTPTGDFALDAKEAIWSEDAARSYAQAAGAQWDPNRAIPWNAPVSHSVEIEDAIVQIMTYLIENETAALIAPVRFMGRVHPHFREVIQVLAVQAADEARHIEVFTRRALLRREAPGRSAASGQASLASLLDEDEFSCSSFLLSVLGEGTFLSLLWFLHEHAPDACTREVVRLAAQDEARHVAFSLSHLSYAISREPGLRNRLFAAVERRHAALVLTAGLDQEVFDSLVLLAAGSLEASGIRKGYAAVMQLIREMDESRRRHLLRLGFSEEVARTLSSLHTRNFM